MGSVFATPALRPVTVCGRRLEHSAHICAFFESSDEEYDCLVPYFAEGLAQDEQVISIRDSSELGAHQKRLAESGLLTAAAVRSNQLRLLASEETYLQDGHFEVERMYSMIETVLREAAAGPFGRVRTCGDMSWALRELPGTDALMEYEARVNRLTQEHDCTLMCAYDVNRFSGRVLMDVLSTHPLVVMGRSVVENPYYIPPAQFLRRLLHRGAAAPLARS